MARPGSRDPDHIPESAPAALSAGFLLTESPASSGHTLPPRAASASALTAALRQSGCFPGAGQGRSAAPALLSSDTVPYPPEDSRSGNPSDETASRPQ